MRVKTNVCFLLAALLSACSSANAPGPVPSPGPTPTAPPAARVQLSGRVLDEHGAPVADTVVEVTYLTLTAASSTPVSHCPAFHPLPWCWLATRSNNLGEYSVAFEPLPWPNHGLGYVSAIRDGYELDVQWVPVGTSPAVRDMSTRSSRKIVPGDSALISVGPASSLCTDREDLWVLDNRCQIVVIESGPGVLTVEARALSGSVVPSMYWYTSGNYGGLITRPAPGIVSIPVKGGTYRILVGLPEGSPAQQFNVTTSLR